MSKYSITVNSAIKKLDIAVEGTVSPAEAESFIKDYNRKISSIDTSAFEVVFNCTDLNVSAPDMLLILKGCFELYKQANYKKYTFLMKKNVVLKMQLSRLAREVGLANMEFIES